MRLCKIQQIAEQSKDMNQKLGHFEMLRLEPVDALWNELHIKLNERLALNEIITRSELSLAVIQIQIGAFLISNRCIVKQLREDR